jgi:hypothetical protein
MSDVNIYPSLKLSWKKEELSQRIEVTEDTQWEIAREIGWHFILGTIIYVNNKNQLHNPYGPAVTYPNGTKEWYQNNHLHRLDGPAIEFADGKKSWFVNGHIIGRSAYGFTPEKFEEWKLQYRITSSLKLSWYGYDYGSPFGRKVHNIERRDVKPINVNNYNAGNWIPKLGETVKVKDTHRKFKPDGKEALIEKGKKAEVVGRGEYYSTVTLFFPDYDLTLEYALGNKDLETTWKNNFYDYFKPWIKVKEEPDSYLLQESERND